MVISSPGPDGNASGRRSRYSRRFCRDEATETYDPLWHIHCYPNGCAPVFQGMIRSKLSQAEISNKLGIHPWRGPNAEA